MGVESSVNSGSQPGGSKMVPAGVGAIFFVRRGIEGGTRTKFSSNFRKGSKILDLQRGSA